MKYRVVPSLASVLEYSIFVQFAHDLPSHNVELIVTDSNSAADTQTFIIVVANVNDSPTITSTAVTSATENVEYSYTVTTSDIDSGDTVTVTAPTKPDWLSFNQETNVLSGTPKMKPLEKRVLNMLDDNVGEIIGKKYAERYFPAESKKLAENMVEFIKNELSAANY